MDPLCGREEGRKVGEGSGCPCLWVLSPSPPVSAERREYHSGTIWSW